MATGDRVDPFAQYNFLVEIDGVTRAGFTEVGGLTTEQDVIEYREGADSATKRKLPGLRKYSNITLKRGFTINQELWLWRKTTIDGVTERRSGSIILLDEARNEALRWNFVEGWLCKWEAPALNAGTNEAAIESMEICHEGLEQV
ncbi:MAG TPA: phage tail protein [Caldilineaceae bacterium]|nr:phage tail protein [Caldilineaceae bacterium]